MAKISTVRASSLTTAGWNIFCTVKMVAWDLALDLSEEDGAG
jgi:hypothetical protein